MKMDIFTKAVLSTIAICLVWLSFNRLTPLASAQVDAQKVVVIGWERPLPVVVVDEKGIPLITLQGLRVNLGNQPLPVTLGNQTVPVAIKSIERRGAWQPIQVDVIKTPPSPYPGP